jgi:hypothetical protein
MAKTTSILGIGEIKTPRFKTDATGAVTADGDNLYYFQCGSVYADTKVQAATGVTFIAPEDWKGQEPLVPVAQLILSNKLERWHAQCVRTQNGSDTLGTSALLCTPAKSETLKGPKTTLKDVELKYNAGKGVIKTIGKVFNVRQKTKDTFN